MIERDNQQKDILKVVAMKEPINKKAVELAKQPLTQEILKQLFEYSPNTGYFTYKVRTGGNNYTGKVVEGGSSKPYIQIQIGGIFYSVHRLAFLYMLNELPEEVDHIDGNTRNNTWNNLRKADRQENRCNTKLPRNNLAGVKGISWSGYKHYKNSRQQYTAKVGYGFGKYATKSFSVSKYGTKELALVAATSWVMETRQQLHGEFTNHGN